MLRPGRYWLEANIVGPEDNFWLIVSDFRGSGCWVNWGECGGLINGLDQFGAEFDLSWSLHGSRTCFPDLDFSGAVDVGDLVAVLTAWGTCPNERNCTEDLDGSGGVDLGDLLIVLGEWGLCGA